MKEQEDKQKYITQRQLQVFASHEFTGQATDINQNKQDKGQRNTHTHTINRKHEPSEETFVRPRLPHQSA
jgi:hypothetical protein